MPRTTHCHGTATISSAATITDKIPLWHQELRQALGRARSVSAELAISDQERQQIARQVDGYPMLIPAAYAQLIDWQDPQDPLRRVVMPSDSEVVAQGAWDTSGEAESVVAQGLQHKYRETAVILMTQACAGHCR